jgi:acyl carrier protein
MPTDEEIRKQVRSALVEALGVDEDDVVSEAILTKDLEAESIDFLDIIFRLEKAFKIKIPREDIFPQTILSNREYVENGRLKRAGLAALKERCPYLDTDHIESKIESFEMQDLFTVSMLESYIRHRLNSSA